MRNMQHRRIADSIGQCSSHVERMFALLGACVLVWMAGYSTPARADGAKVKVVWVQSFHIIDPATGKAFPAPVHLKYKQKASARCDFEFISEGGRPFNVPSFNIAMYFQRSDMTGYKSYIRPFAVWDPHMKYDGAIGSGTAMIPVNTGGLGLFEHTGYVQCSTFRSAAGVSNKTIEFTIEKKFTPKPPMVASIHIHGSGKPLSAKRDLAKMPNPHIRKCPTSVKATSTIDPHAFLAPFATASNATNIPAGHLTLYLDKTQAINDSMFCTYATRAGNGQSTVEIACKGARLQDKASHAYYCQ